MMQWIALGFLIACVAVELSILVIGPGADLLQYLKEKVMASRCGRQTTIDFGSIVRIGSSFDPQKRCVKGGKPMNVYSVSIKAEDKELKEILEELTKAQETIYQCYSRLNNLGVIEFCKKEAASSKCQS